MDIEEERETETIIVEPLEDPVPKRDPEPVEARADRGPRGRAGARVITEPERNADKEAPTEVRGTSRTGRHGWRNARPRE